MWHETVSAANRAANSVLGLFLDAFWRHPLIASGFLSALFILAMLFWVESIKDQADRRAEPADRPILVRR